MTIRTKAIALCALTQILAAPALCAIPRDRETVWGIDFSKIVNPMAPASQITAYDVARYIPCDMQPTGDESRVARRIIEHSFNSWMKSDHVRGSDFGRTARAAEEVMDQDISVGGDDGGVKHSFKFSLKPLQSRAQIDYKGVVNAQISYQASDGGRFAVEVSETIYEAAQLVVSHVDSDFDRRDMVSLRLTF